MMKMVINILANGNMGRNMAMDESKSVAACIKASM